MAVACLRRSSYEFEIFLAFGGRLERQPGGDMPKWKCKSNKNVHMLPDFRAVFNLDILKCTKQKSEADTIAAEVPVDTCICLHRVILNYLENDA